MPDPEDCGVNVGILGCGVIVKPIGVEICVPVPKVGEARGVSEGNGVRVGASVGGRGVSVGMAAWV